MSKLTVDKDNPFYDSRDNCNAIIDSTYDTLIIGTKETIIPKTVKSIGMGAFSFCIGLRNIVIPESVNTIDYIAFRNCKDLTAVSIACPSATIKEDAFYECESLNEIIILDSVVDLSGWDFIKKSRGTTSITKIVVPYKKAAFYKKQLPRKFHKLVVEQESTDNK